MSAEWVENNLKVYHVDSKRLLELKSRFEGKSLFRQYGSIDTDAVMSGDLWKLPNWGTHQPLVSDSFRVSEDGTKAILTFCTAWCPPIEQLFALERSGFEVAMLFKDDERTGSYCHGQFETSAVDNSRWGANVFPDSFEEGFGWVRYPGKMPEGCR